MCFIIDVEDVKYVINFDYPNSSEDYIHRIGRTGRCQQPGTAYTFFTPNNQRQAKELIAVLTEANQPINSKLADLAALAKASYSSKLIFLSYLKSYQLMYLVSLHVYMRENESF